MLIRKLLTAATLTLPFLILDGTSALPASGDGRDCTEEGESGDIHFEHDRRDECRGRHRNQGHSRDGHGKCYLNTAWVDPGHRSRKGRTFPRIQDAIDAVKPGGTVIIHTRTGSLNPRGGLHGDRGHVFLESLEIDKPLILAGGNNERSGWGRLSSGPDGRCLRINLKPRGGPCYFKPEQAEVHVRNLRWAEIFGREPSEAPCIHVQKGRLNLSYSHIDWQGSRSALRVASGAAARLQDVAISVSDGTGRAVSAYDGELQISGGTFTGNLAESVFLISGGTWAIDGADITGGMNGIALTLDAGMQGRLTASSLTGNGTGLSVVGTGDTRSVSARVRITGGNEFVSNEIGAFFQSVGRVNFSGNRLVGNRGAGLVIDRSSGAFRRNLFLNNNVGIRVGGAPHRVPDGSPAHAEITGNQIQGRMRHAIEILPGGQAAISGNSINAPKCHCVWGDLDSAGLLFGRSDCPGEEWSRSCRRYRERRLRELQEKGEELPPADDMAPVYEEDSVEGGEGVPN